MITAMSDRITVISDAIADAISLYRKKNGLTRAELATELWDAGASQAMSAAVVGYIETGRRDKEGARRREITVDELALFARAMKSTVAELLGEHAAMLGLDQAPPCPSCERRKRSGPVQDQVRADVELFDELEDFEPTLVQMAYALAREIDLGSEKLPSLTRELRFTLHELTSARQRPPAEEDDLDDAGDPD